jgi:hypothetical protein
MAHLRASSGIFSRAAFRASASLGSSSGPATDGMWAWCSKPSSGAWKDAARLKICLPFWTAITRRVVKLPPSRDRSTSKRIGMVGSPGRMK